MQAKEQQLHEIGTIDQLRVVPPLSSRADALFVQLDRQRVGVGPGGWIAEVYGIHLRQEEAWVQIAPAGDPAGSVVLHLFASSTISHALGALAAWSRQPPADRLRVIDVMHVASACGEG